MFKDVQPSRLFSQRTIFSPIRNTIPICAHHSWFPPSPGLGNHSHTISMGFPLCLPWPAILFPTLCFIQTESPNMWSFVTSYFLLGIMFKRFIQCCSRECYCVVFCGWIIFHCITIILLGYPHSWCIFVLFLRFGNEKYCYEHTQTSFCFPHNH